MRSTLAALALAVAVAIGLAVPAATPVRAATAADGRTQGRDHRRRDARRDRAATATYADEAYAEAIKYTPNVVKVYSPNATWSKVKAAAVGASIVIYFGHGNGWPSPYTYDPNYTTKDGFGLNATAGNGDNNNKYYGEPYVATLDLAPNAIVLLHHLCYASGNSEPGHAAPSLTTAKQRVDNYGAGFLRTKARGRHRRRPPRPGRVPAGDLHDQPDDRAAVADRARTPTATSASFPSTPDARDDQGVHGPRQPTSSGFYRSLVGDPGLTTKRDHAAASPSRAGPRPRRAGAPLYARPAGDDHVDARRRPRSCPPTPA